MKGFLRFRQVSLLILAFALFGAGSAAYSQSVISGHIFDDSRSPVSNMLVELQDDNYQVAQTTRTNSSGVYFFRNLRSGLYYVHVRTIGTNLLEQTQQVEIASRPIRGASTGVSFESKDIFLRAAREPASRPAMVVFAQDVPKEAKKAFDDATAEIARKNLTEAVRLLEHALEIFPAYYDALEKLGDEDIRLGKYQEALLLFARSVEVYPASYSGWYGRAYAQYNLLMSNAAIESLGHALTIQSRSADAYLLLGAAYRQAGKYDLAEKHLKKANELTNGASPDVHWNLALLYGHNLLRYEAAADELEAYLKTATAPNAELVKKLIAEFRRRGKTSPGGTS